MKDRISALMDGELDEREAAATIAALGSDPQARHAWRTYHLIGDALRESGAVIAPRQAANSPAWRIALPAMAVAAAVALVSWVAFAPQQPDKPAVQPPVAQAPAPALPPKAANDYLLAHQNVSPRVALQGMSVYVRTVADPAEEPRR